MYDVFLTPRSLSASGKARQRVKLRGLLPLLRLDGGLPGRVVRAVDELRTVVQALLLCELQHQQPTTFTEMKTKLHR